MGRLQKIFPQQAQRLPGTVDTVLRIIAIILSSLGFFLSLAGIIVSAIVLHYAHGHEGWLAGGVVGLVASILVLIVCVAIFVIAVATLARRMRRVRTKISRLANSDNLAIMRSATHQIDADMFGINNRRDNNRDE